MSFWNHVCKGATKIIVILPSSFVSGMVGIGKNIKYYLTEDVWDEDRGNTEVINMLKLLNLLICTYGADITMFQVINSLKCLSVVHNESSYFLFPLRWQRCLIQQNFLDYT